jgi:predicted nuclease of predicted toxin-antitoxin system
MLLYLDEDVHLKLARELRRRGVDAISAGETGMREQSDDAQLAFAVSQGRAIVTFNVGDYVKLHARYLKSAVSHYGVIVSPQYTIGETLRRVLKLVNTLSAEEMRNRLEYLSQWGD